MSSFDNMMKNLGFSAIGKRDTNIKSNNYANLLYFLIELEISVLTHYVFFNCLPTRLETVTKPVLIMSMNIMSLKGTKIPCINS